MCKGAINNGAIGIAITDHCDIDGNDFDVDKQFNDVFDVQKEFEGQLLVLKGIELGQGIYKKDYSMEVLNNHNYDFVLGSIHNLENEEDFYYLDYKHYDIDKLLSEYFNAELELAKWNKTDSLAHLTYPLRYIVVREHINVDISKFYDIIDEIFKTLIYNDKALELNVSGLFMDMKDTLPNKSLIKRFHDMGGKYVTVGSDSHYRNKVCNGIENGYDILKECGYDNFTIFKNREPVLVPIK
jgi:histidinol-phosphatase (PHP family)